MCISIVWCLVVEYGSERPHPTDPPLGPEPVGWGEDTGENIEGGTTPTPGGSNTHTHTHTHTRTWGQMPSLSGYRLARDGSRIFAVEFVAVLSADSCSLPCSWQLQKVVSYEAFWCAWSLNVKRPGLLYITELAPFSREPLEECRVNSADSRISCSEHGRTPCGSSSCFPFLSFYSLYTW
jgi:hypothetical protein